MISCVTVNLDGKSSAHVRSEARSTSASKLKTDSVVLQSLMFCFKKRSLCQSCIRHSPGYLDFIYLSYISRNSFICMYSLFIHFGAPYLLRCFLPIGGMRHWIFIGLETISCESLLLFDFAFREAVCTVGKK